MGVILPYGVSKSYVDGLIGAGESKLVFLSDVATGGASLAPGAKTTEQLGPDDTEAVAEVLDMALTQPLLLAWDLPVSVDEIVVNPFTTVIVYPGCGAVLRNGANKPLVRLANPHPTIISDEHIHIRGGVWHANRYGQTFPGGSDWIWTAQTVPSALGFYGARHVTIHGAEFRAAQGFHFHFANLDSFSFKRITIDAEMGSASYTMDGIHGNGPLSNGTIEDCEGASYDDFIALQAAELFNASDPEGVHHYDNVTLGPITDVHVNRVRFRDSLFGVRINSGVGAEMDRVYFTNLSGRVIASVAVGNPIWGPETPLPASDFRKVVFDNVDVKCATTADPEFQRIFHFVGRYRQLELLNIKRDADDDRPLIHLRNEVGNQGGGGYTTAPTEIDKLTITASTHETSTDGISLLTDSGTTVHHLVGRIAPFKSPAGTAKVVQNNGTVDWADMSGYPGYRSLLWGGNPATNRSGSAFIAAEGPGEPTTDPLFEWLFSDDLTDNIGSNDLSAVGSPTFVTGKVGNGLACSTGNYAGRASTADLSAANVDFWRRGWVKFTTLSGTTQFIFDKSSGVGSYEQSLYWFATNGKLNFTVNQSAGVGQVVTCTAMPNVVVDTWYHWLVWHDSVNDIIGIRVNDTYENTAAYSGGCNNGGGDFYVGHSPNGGDLIGIVDQIRGGKDALPSAGDNTADYNGGAGM